MKTAPLSGSLDHRQQVLRDTDAKHLFLVHRDPPCRSTSRHGGFCARCPTHVPIVAQACYTYKQDRHTDCDPSVARPPGTSTETRPTSDGPPRSSTRMIPASCPVASASAARWIALVHHSQMPAREMAV
jgi:hypothetical protein